MVQHPSNNISIQIRVNASSLLVNFFPYKLWRNFNYSKSGILRDKTMVDKLKNIPIDYKENCCLKNLDIVWKQPIIIQYVPQTFWANEWDNVVIQFLVQCFPIPWFKVHWTISLISEIREGGDIWPKIVLVPKVF